MEKPILRFRGAIAAILALSFAFPGRLAADSGRPPGLAASFGSIAHRYFACYPRPPEGVEEGRGSYLLADATTAATEEAPQEGDADAVTGASEDAPLIVDGVTGASEPKPFLGFKSRTSFHRFAGWTSGALLLAAGIVGVVRVYGLMEKGHRYRDELGIDDDEIGDECSTYIRDIWDDGGGQALRWTHVGLVAAGETLYLTDAVTGIQMMRPDGPGISKADIHRYAFFVHGALMIAEAILGFMTTDALRRGDHEAITSIGVAHAGVGLAIPIVILSAGAVMEFGH